MQTSGYPGSQGTGRPTPATPAQPPLASFPQQPSMNVPSHIQTNSNMSILPNGMMMHSLQPPNHSNQQVKFVYHSSEYII